MSALSEALLTKGCRRLLLPRAFVPAAAAAVNDKALLLQEDVSLVLAHVLASADGAAAGASKRNSITSGRGRLALPPSSAAADKKLRPRIDAASSQPQQRPQGVHQRQLMTGGHQQGRLGRDGAWLRAVERSSRPFLVDDRQARLLAAEFAAFCGSGLSVADYDAAEELRHRHQRQRQQRILMLHGADGGSEGSAAAESPARLREQGPQAEEQQDRREGKAEAAAAGVAARDVVAYLSDDGADLRETDDDDAAPGDFWSSGDER